MWSNLRRRMTALAFQASTMSAAQLQTAMVTAAAAAQASAYASVPGPGMRLPFYVGVTSRKEPEIIMRQVVGALRAIGAEVAVKPDFRLLARWRPSFMDLDAADVGDELVYFGLQVYKTAPHAYVVDVFHSLLCGGSSGSASESEWPRPSSLKASNSPMRFFDTFLVFLSVLMPPRRA